VCWASGLDAPTPTGTQRRLGRAETSHSVLASGLGGVCTRITSGLVQRGKSSRAKLLGISVVILKAACAFRECARLLVLEKGLLPRRFLERFHSLFFLRSKRGDADAPGLPSGISPRPRCGSDLKKKNLLPGSGLVVSGLVSCVAPRWCGEFFVASQVLNLCLSSWVFGWIQCRAFWIQCPCTGVVPRRPSWPS
jgi:hypothetical protein